MKEIPVAADETQRLRDSQFRSLVAIETVVVPKDDPVWREYLESQSTIFNHCLKPVIAIDKNKVEGLLVAQDFSGVGERAVSQLHL